MNLRSLLRTARAAGCTVEDGGKKRKHLRILTPSGGAVVCSRTPSDNRALLNIRADLRRAGVVI